MENPVVRAALLLAVVLAGTAFTFRMLWKMEGISRKHVVISSALCLLGLLGVIPGIRERVASLPFPEGETGGYVLIGFVLVSGTLLGLVLTGRRAIAALARGLADRLRIALEEFRNPALRERNRCVRRYQRALDILATPVAGNPHRLRRNRLYVVLTLRDLSDKDTEHLAGFLNVFLFEGTGPVDRLVAFLREERGMVATDLRAAGGHLIRLNQLSDRIRSGNVAA